MSEVAQVPQLRFPEFSGEWEDGKLGNYGNLINGLTYSPDNIVDDGLLVLRSSNVQNGQIYLNDNVYVNLDVDDAALTREDDILICVRNGSKRLIGKSTIINKNLPKSTHGAFMTVFRGESNKFISHWFHSSIYYKEVHKNLGATINSINGSDLKKFKTIFPLKPEQQRIAAFLTAVDNKIEQLSKKQALLGSWKKGLMQQIFSQATRFKADDDSEFPDWEERVLGDYLAHKSKKNKNNEVDLVLSVSNKKGFITQDEQFDGYQVASKDLTNYKIVEKGEYAYNPSRINVGSIARLKNNTIGIVSPMYVVFKLKNLDSIFFDNLYQTHLFKHLIKVGCSGSVRDSLNFNDMADFVFSFPSLEEQAKIVNFLSSIDSKIEQVGKQLDESKQFKKALLQQMFV